MFNIAVHGHFYQPPREDPWSNAVLKDPTASPAHDWNQRIASECYRPNCAAKVLGPDGRIASVVNNYSHLSFNFGPTLHRWIEKEDPVLDLALRESGRKAIAQCYSHMIMPLASAEDKKTQTIWGIKDFEYRFKRRPKGMWLPETAVNTAALEILSENGMSFTILAPSQCEAVIIDGVRKETPYGKGLDVTLPYLCRLPSGRTITIVFYHGGLAHDIAFGKLLENGDRFRDALVGAIKIRSEERLLVVATDGETYGHHHKFGEMALARLFERLETDPEVRLPDIGTFLEDHPAKFECVIRENTSWSCVHGIERWRSDCGCSTGGKPGWKQAWRGPLREAFDKLAERVDGVFSETVSPYFDPWELRNLSIEHFRSAGHNNKEEYERGLEFLSKHLGSIGEREGASILSALEAERMRMFMYTSCGWFFNDISGVETKQVISFAIRAAELAGNLSDWDIMSDLLTDLEKAEGNSKEYPNARVTAEREIMHKTHCNGNGRNGKYTNGAASLVSDLESTGFGGEKMTDMNYGGNLAQSILSTLERDPAFRNVAYFSMEIGLTPEIPTYSGGLGILAGDILKSAADLGVPMVGITLLYKKGYFAQKINNEGRQTERPVDWDPSKLLTFLPNSVSIMMNHREVKVGVWSYTIIGNSGHPIPILFLDTDLPENTPEDRALTDELYGGDNRYRLCQELILGIGGLRILRDLGYRNVKTFHLNEGHAGFITLELLREQGYPDLQKIRNQVVFTTHTPVEAGHDFFSYDLINEVIESTFIEKLRNTVGGSGLSMTDLALKFSRYVNGVSRKHAEVSRAMFNNDSIDWVTNGVHSTTWTCESFAALYDKYILGWRTNTSRLMQAIQIPNEEIWEAHRTAKLKLLDMVFEETGQKLDPDILTIGFARRAATYKRADLIFTDIKRLLEIGAGKIQFIFSGKAHPHDEPGKDILQKIHNISKELGTAMPVVFIENYNMTPAKLITSGVDLWLNTPVRPREASGTSGMKCVHNGIMNFSVLDGWWIEGCLEGHTGWAIGPEPGPNDMRGYDESQDAEDLYRKLQIKILPLYYNNRPRWIRMMKLAISINASYFNTHRVVREYCEKAYGTVFRGL
ncbi:MULTISPECIES: alpha-glucan family phosphorylase [Synergistaceae]|uniref:alpha-glucan family phosphorylase n=1 Tax=Synergistaceae TaxID=649777 RepID=UPI003AE26A8F